MTQNGKFQFSRLESLLKEAARSPARRKRPQDPDSELTGQETTPTGAVGLAPDLWWHGVLRLCQLKGLRHDPDGQLRPTGNTARREAQQLVVPLPLPGWVPHHALSLV